MSRRETAVCCALGIFLALLTTGCEGRMEARPKRPLETADREAATEIAWGEAVNGLQAGLEIKGRHFETGAPICAVIHVRNLGQKEIKLYDATWEGSWSVVFRSHADDAPMRACRLVRDDHPAMNVAVPTGAEREAVRLIMAAPTWRFLELPEARVSTSALSSGGYTVTASSSSFFGEPVPTPFREYWRGEVTTGAVAIEIVEQGRPTP